MAGFFAIDVHKSFALPGGVPILMQKDVSKKKARCTNGFLIKIQ
jgi:hypothetical protein